MKLIKGKRMRGGMQTDRLQGPVYAGWEWVLLPTTSWELVPLSFAQALRKLAGSMDRQCCTEVKTVDKEVESGCLVGQGRWESNSAIEDEEVLQKSEAPLCSGDWHAYNWSHNFLPRNPVLAPGRHL